MKAIRFYLDEATDRGLAKNDSDIARHLGVSRATVSDWRVGRTAPNEDQAAALAALLGKPEVMAECMAARRGATPAGVALRFKPAGPCPELIYEGAPIKGRGCAPSILTRSRLRRAAACGRSLDGLDGIGQCYRFA